MKNIFSSNFFIAFISFLPLCEAVSDTVEMKSPDGKYILKLSDEGGSLSYSLDWSNKTIIRESSLGLKLNEEWKDALSISGIKTYSKNTSWKPVYGEKSVINDCYNAWSVNVDKKDSRIRIGLEFRLYNEGVAFRYNFQGNSYLSIKDEYTEFSFPQGTKAYYSGTAESVFTLLPLRGWNGESERPLLLTLSDGTYACLMEAEVVDYVRTKFKLSSVKENTIATSMYGQVDEISPYHTPWRVIMCGETAGDILENNYLMLNLNPESKLKDTSWIKPGKVIRVVGDMSTETGKEFIDFAVKRDLQYVHFDAGWYGSEFTKTSDASSVYKGTNRKPNVNTLDLKEVCRYAKERNIGVMLYVNQRALQQQLDEILPIYKSWGIAGLKFGFVLVGSQVWTKWLHEAVRKCADYGLMVDIHDHYRPTGVSRTYPNLMTQEGIYGNEQFPDATHNATLPFTRFVAGAADYTICYYKQEFKKLTTKEHKSTASPKSRILKTTPAHQLALSVVYYSPLQFMFWYDKPSDSKDEPELKFFNDVYTVWDDTKVLQSEVGKCVSIARRKDREWFVGGITNNDTRKMKISLDFLDKKVKYDTEIYTDGNPDIPTRTKVLVTKKSVTNKNKLKFDLKPSGGVAIRFVPKK